MEWYGWMNLALDEYQWWGSSEQGNEPSSSGKSWEIVE
jgi:hypothetical protein